MPNTFSVISVSYNNQSTISTFINSVIKNSKASEIIIIDNKSADQTTKIVKKFAQIKLIRLDKNLGFAKANNLGARLSQSDYLIFLNPDTEILTKGSLEKLVNNLEKYSKYGLIGPKFINPDGTTQKTIRNLPGVKRAFNEYLLNKKDSYDFYEPDSQKLSVVESVVGAGMVIKRELFLKLGGFDEKYFLYFEDIDLCKKILKSGLKVGYNPKIKLLHILGVSGQHKEVNKLLIASAKKYHGHLEFYLIQLIIRIGRLIHYEN